MKKLAVIFLLLIRTVNGLSQQIDLAEIKASTNDPYSKYFYDTLVRRFLEQPYDFEMAKGMNLYYGKLYSKNYQPHPIDGQENNFADWIRRENYDRAIVIGENMLEKDPVNVSLLLQLLKCYEE